MSSVHDLVALSLLCKECEPKSWWFITAPPQQAGISSSSEIPANAYSSAQCRLEGSFDLCYSFPCYTRISPVGRANGDASKFLAKQKTRAMSRSLSLDDEPSFDLGRAQTSTPNKARGLRTRYPTQRGEIGDAEPLHDSDTDSIAGEAHDPQTAYTGEGDEVRDGRSTPLTRRSLLQLDSVDPLPPPRAAPLATIPVDPHSGLHDRRTLEALRREHLYAPSPSTGSSTLVDRDHEPPLASSKTRYSGFQVVPNFRDSSPRLTEATGPPPRPRMEGIFERDGGPSEDESVASQQLRRSRIGDLASFVDSRLTQREEHHSQSTTPRRRQSLRVSASERSRDFDPAAAPVLPVSTPRLSASARSSTPNGRNEREAVSPSPVGSTQVHDVFKRLITGPDGALAHSAARRAAAAATTASCSSASLSASYNRYEEQQQQPPPTPAPPGHYTFVPTSSLPVQREVPGRVSQERTHPLQGTLRSDVQIYEEVRYREEGPSQLERALQHLSEAQRDSESHQGTPVYPREAVSRNAHGAVERTRSTPTLPEGRSAIDFAMAESSAFSHSEDDEEVAAARDPHANLRNSVRFAAEPTYRDQSPSRSLSPPPPSPPPASASFANQSTFAGPGAFPRSTSPDLPPLPLPLPPESPEAARVAVSKTRSPPSRFRRSRASPPEEPHLSPPRHDPVSPNRPNRRPGWERPASSTPPRHEGVEPPRPRGTPEHRPDLSLSRTARVSSSSSSTSPPSTWQDHHADEQPSLIEPLRFEPSPPPPPPRLEENESNGAADESSTSIKIKELVSQLSAAVQTLAEREPQVLPSPPPPDDRLDLVQPEGEDEPPLPARLRSELERRRQASDQLRQSLDAELDGIDAKTAANQVRHSNQSLEDPLFSRNPADLGRGSQDYRSEMMHRLVETYEREHELGCRMEELKRSIEGIGQLVGDQVR